ncbi:sensor histidine kinase [Haloarcula sebkhae]|uniref:sensor histidine kinase n=1 Tax=Haloarcula sebkhae TaxID=932660 RepID=UPI0036F213CA
MVITMWFSTFDDHPLAVDDVELMLPLFSGIFIIGFGWWISQNRMFDFDAQKRILAALGFIAGSILFTAITSWILLIVNIENGLIGSYFPVYLNGVSIGIVGNGILTTLYLQFRQQHRQIQAHNAELEQTNERLTRLSGVLSHDLRNPLNVAQGRLDILKKSTESEHIAAIDRSLDRIENIITDTLALTQQTQLTADTTSVALDSVARSAWETVETNNVEFQIEGLMTVEVDEPRVRQAFENLFRNAIDHGGDQLTVVKVGRLGHSGFYIEDNGIGFPEDTADEVFDWGMTTAATGTGLGLAIVEEVISAHGWNITTMTGAEGGARFEITNVT